jgi:hypothetical protein
MLYRISYASSDLSITRIRRALLDVLKKHSVLRTALYIDTNGRLVQQCMHFDELNDHQEFFGFTITEFVDNNDLEAKYLAIMSQCDLFDLTKGRIMQCYILRPQHRHHLSVQNDDLLTTDDLILLIWHHSIIDGESISLVLLDLFRLYENDCSLLLDDNALQYIDYSVHERLIDITSACKFWYSQLEGYNFRRPLSLPIDRRRLPTERRSTRSAFVDIRFNEDIITTFINYASLKKVTLFQLALATFYAFLFKLTNDENDICITCLDANRYKPELQDMIGMFVATLPCRIQFKPHWSFDELVKYVQEKYLSIREHSHYPLQQILADFNVNNSNVTFLEILFEFKTHMSEDNQVNLSGANLQQISIPSTTENSFVDFEMMFEYDHTRDTGKLGCFLFGSVDHFNETTINKMGRKFEHFYSQLFTTNLNAITIDKCVTPISRLSLILPEEDQEMQGVVFRRLSDIGNKGISISLYDLFHATLILI